MKVHLSSALLGGGISCLAVLAIGAQGVSLPAGTRLLLGPGQVIRVRGIPAPEDMIRVVEGAPFTVPTGKILVITGLGVNGDVTPGRATITFDGTPVYFKQWRNLLQGNSIGFATTGSIPPGLTACAGTLVSVDNSLGPTFQAMLLGYLADVDF